MQKMRENSAIRENTQDDRLDHLIELVEEIKKMQDEVARDVKTVIVLVGVLLSFALYYYFEE